VIPNDARQQTRIATVLSRFRSRFVVDIGLTFGSRILLLGVGLVTSMLTAKVLGPAGRGYFSVAMAIVALGAQFGNLGLHASNAWVAGRRRDLVGALTANSFVVSAAFGMLAFATAGALAIANPRLLPLHGRLLFLALASVPVGLLYLLLQNILVGLNEVKAYNAMEIVNRVSVMFALLLLAGVRDLTADSAVLVTLAGVVLATVLILGRLGPYSNGPWRPSRSVFDESFWYGCRAYTVAALGFVVLRSDLFLVNQMLGPAQAGYYSIASAMADMLFLLPSAVGTVLFPKLLTFDQQARWPAVRSATTHMGAGMLLTIIGAIVLCRPAVQLLYGRAYLPAVAPFIVLAVGALFYGTNTPLSIYMASIGFPWLSIAAWGVAAFLNVGLNLYVIPAYGIMGAAISSLICYAAIFFMHLLILRRITRQPSAQLQPSAAS